MEWTRETPIEIGWYWCYLPDLPDENLNKGRMVRFYYGSNYYLFDGPVAFSNNAGLSMLDAYWYGPLEPSEPSKADD